MLKDKTREKGFSYIDVVIAIVILMVGILAMVSALTANLIRSYEAEKRVVAKQMAISTIESIISAKDIEQAGVIDGWDSIRNRMTNPPVGEINGIFLPDWRPIRADNGWDGVAGTIDDACNAPGACAVSGRPTNNSEVDKLYERRILIEDIADPERPTPPYSIFRRRIEVTIRFSSNQAIREEKISTIITNY